MLPPFLVVGDVAMPCHAVHAYVSYHALGTIAYRVLCMHILVGNSKPYQHSLSHAIIQKYNKICSIPAKYST